MTGLETALAVVAETMVEPGRLDLARRSPSGCPRRRPASAGSRATAGRSPSASRPTSAWSTRLPAGPSTRPRCASRSRNTPFAGRELPARVVATFLRGRADRPRRRSPRP